jgi:phosphoribosylformylglycinamidine synthase subunit PurQ / glutaminase
MSYGVIVFPGSNCDHDAYNTAGKLSGADVQYIWHKETSIPSDVKCIIIPGGFSYGDYLRCGAVARFSSVMAEVIEFANSGGLVIGICNGFQILTECGLLPGALLRNSSLNFVCKDTYLKVNNSFAFTSGYDDGEVIKVPVAHGEGNYYADAETLKSLQDNNQIAFTYVSGNGEESTGSNPNGSALNIAGITNKNGNVLGMMPHPERYSEELLGCGDGLKVFGSINSAIA